MTFRITRYPDFWLVVTYLDGVYTENEFATKSEADEFISASQDA